ncbi:uncharacterized protein BJ171DRAFT_491607 [Polychytrium aggregatum]|uniref:uncharacterized protein n=1 Tax=Polychytrium aggregatum TaxID=110093 RepID=UPI0022FEBE57|nr:uncharacterized protein BJ171DRAFT_491607 [Polychytrium aggregatum]KAI9207822.1 hypothetical protein BJ171DRAFT_491607 [Polychytrium aggregatum]
MRFNLLVLLVALIAATCSLALSTEEKESRKSAAEAADLEIDFIDHDKVNATLHNGKGITALMFGAKWCAFTQRFTPKWLEVQKAVKAQGIDKGNFQMFKVECSIDEPFCTVQYNIAGYPTVLFYRDGLLQGEYPDDDEPEVLLRYIKKQVSSYDAAVSSSAAAAAARATSTAALLPSAPAPQQLEAVTDAPKSAAAPLASATQAQASTADKSFVAENNNSGSANTTQTSSGWSSFAVIGGVAVFAGVGFVGYRALKRNGRNGRVALLG